MWPGPSCEELAEMSEEALNNPLFIRSLPLLGQELALRLSAAKIAIFGLGGVGSFAAEALARLGVGGFLLVDGDKIEKSNLNRQLYALHSSLGEKKSSLARKRILDINPGAAVLEYSSFVQADEIDAVLSLQADTDIIIDAIDSIESKTALLAKAVELSIPVFSSMGAAFKLDPTKVKTADLSKTHTDPLARIMRKKLKDRGIINLPVVFSDEIADEEAWARFKKMADKAPASSSLVPPAFGLALASLVLQHFQQNQLNS